MAMASRIYSFPPIAHAQSKILILGSMPGKKSLQLQQYYAHPQNLFWDFMQSWIGVTKTASYSTRISALQKARIALWDVLQSCVRPSSLDADIEPESICAHDFAAFFANHPCIKAVFFNGQSAAQSYQRHVLPFLPLKYTELHYQCLPSTSPANASLTRAHKLHTWQQALDAYLA